MTRHLIAVGLLCVLASAALAPAHAEVPPPLKQLASGVPPGEIRCNGDMVPIQNGGRPACVSESSAQKLQQRGWTVVRQLQDRTDAPDVQSEIPANMITIGNMDKTTMAASEGGPPSLFLPLYSLTFPEQVRVGERFEIVLDYTFIVPGLDDDDDGVEFLNYEEPEFVCDEECLAGVTWYGTKFHISRNAYVDLLDDDDYVMTGRGYDKRHIPIREFESGTMLPVLNNTHPQQKTFTFVINEPDTEYPFGNIYIESNADGEGRIHFYVGPDGTVRLSDEPIMVEGEDVPRLVRNLPDPTSVPTYVTPRDPLSGISDPEKLIHDLAPFLEEHYPDSAEAELRLANFTDAFIDRFFELYPDLRTQSSDSSLQSILPSAYAQAPPTSFVYGEAYYYDLDNNRVTLKNTEICAYTKQGSDFSPVKNGRTHM